MFFVDCPVRLKLKEPSISYRTKSSEARPVHNSTIWLSGPGNVTLVITIPAADPPVQCNVTTDQALESCEGTPANDTDCEVELALGQGLSAVVIVALSFIAYKPFTTRLFVHIKGGFIWLQVTLMHCYIKL